MKWSLQFNYPRKYLTVIELLAFLLKRVVDTIFSLVVLRAYVMPKVLRENFANINLALRYL